MKKILLLFIFIIFICGCSKSENVIKLENNLNIEYGSKVYLYDLFDANNYVIKTPNTLVDTSKLGKNNIKIKYLDNNKKEKNFTFLINVVDTTPPVIQSNKTYYTEIGKEINLTDKLFYGDNYDRNLEIKIEGFYDINKTGDYNLKFISTDVNQNTTEKSFTLKVVDKISSSNKSNKKDVNDIIKIYKNNNTLIGIDVSAWQGDIDFEKVKNSGIEFVMIRIGYGYNKENNIIMDKYFKDNLKKAKEVGLKVGIYFYSYAKSNSEAKEQALWIINNLKGEILDLPIAFDWEDWNNFKDYKINFLDLNNIANVFLNTIEDNGYKAMLYGSMYYLNNIWNIDDFSTWLAHYTDKTTYEKDYYIWQLTSFGRVPGINGNVDLNVLYKK